MVSLFKRFTGAGANLPDEQKSSSSQSLFAMIGSHEANWTEGGFSSLASQGYARNPIVYRCVRMIVEAATSVPLVVSQNGSMLEDHPLLKLLKNPNHRQSGSQVMEAVFSYLYTAGNAYLKAVLVDGRVRGLYSLRPDRMHLVSGRDGWPVAYDYRVGGRTIRLSQNTEPVPRVLHLNLFHPLDDHFGFSPLEAARFSLDIHNAAARWNKALLDNAARPSGALVYSGASGNLTKSQFQRLKDELEAGFQGAANAGRPMVLEGGLDWKSMALTPRDMDFIEAKNSAAREIALAFGVPPMLLGIPGDNTYANYSEANRVFWRQSVVPLVRRVASSLGRWLQPAFEGDFELLPMLDDIEALSEDRSAAWQRIGSAEFLSAEEKRRLLGISTCETNDGAVAPEGVSDSE